MCAAAEIRFFVVSWNVTVRCVLGVRCGCVRHCSSCLLMFLFSQCSSCALECRCGVILAPAAFATDMTVPVQFMSDGLSSFVHWQHLDHGSALAALTFHFVCAVLIGVATLSHASSSTRTAVIDARLRSWMNAPDLTDFMPRHVILVGRLDVQSGIGRLPTSTSPCPLGNLRLNRKRHRSNFTLSSCVVC